MAIQQTKVPAKNFRDLIAAVLKFPPSAQVAASEIVHVAVTKGRARASIAGVVVTTASVMATARDLDAFSADYRSLSAYAALLPDAEDAHVELTRKDNQVLLTCGEQKLALALTLGSVLPKPKVPEPFFVATEETAKALKWLAGLAEKDEAKPDMCCVYLKDGAAMAGNQRCIAVMRTPGLPEETLPLPLSLCQVIEPGDKLAKAEGGLLLVSGCGVVQIPYMVQTLQFPVKIVERMEAAQGETFAECKVGMLSEAFKTSADCVARAPKTQAYISMVCEKGGRIRVLGKSQTATFRTVILGEVKKEGELILELPEAEEALSIFGDGVVSCRRLLPKGETSFEYDGAKAFFAPINLVGS